MLGMWRRDWERWFYGTQIVRPRDHSAKALRRLPFIGAVFVNAGIGVLVGSAIAARGSTYVPLWSAWSFTFLGIFVLGIVLCVLGGVLWIVGRAIRAHIWASS
jgi:hypothetical protein